MVRRWSDGGPTCGGPMVVRRTVVRRWSDVERDREEIHVVV